MAVWEDEYAAFWRELGPGGPLATSLDGEVTARTMSVVQLGGRLYFQTDRRFRKYAQLAGNPRAALCAENTQILGRCRELGHPREHSEFCRAYRELYPGSFERYTQLEDERLFVLEPEFVERWLYIGGRPHVETFDVGARRHEIREYRL